VNKKKLITGNLSIELKRTVKSVLWSIVLYTSERWSMTQIDRKRSEAVEMWIWRMDKISCVYKISNEEVLQKNETKTVRYTEKTQRCGYGMC